MATFFYKMDVDCYYDGCACYDKKGKPYCAECYHSGPEMTNCMTADPDYYKSKPFVWDKDKKQFVLVDDNND